MKILRKTLLFLFITAGLIGCSNGGKGSSKNPIELYSDNAVYKDGDIEITFDNLHESVSYSDNLEVRFYLNLTNTNPKPAKYEISSLQLIREENKAEYTVSSGTYYYSPITLECDLKETISFSAVIPVSIEKEKYFFSFEGNDKTYKYNLYEMPDEMRGEATIHYYVDGEDMGTRTVLEGKKISKYDWIGDDYVYACNTWYIDSEMKNLISPDSRVYGNITVFGSKKFVLRYGLYSGYAHVAGYNLIPSTGEIVIPKQVSWNNGIINYTVNGIDASAFPHDCKGLKELYIPKMVTIAYQMNFFNCTDLQTIYYEGDEAEWNTVNQALLPANTTVVFNTYK